MTYQNPKFETNLPLGVHLRGHVSFDWAAVGETLAHGNNLDQAEFFKGFTERINLWPLSDRLAQVYFIADAIKTTDDQKKLAAFLKSLASALEGE